MYCSMQQNIVLEGKYILKISVKNKNDLYKFVERKSPKHNKLLSMTYSKPKGQAWGTIDVCNVSTKNDSNTNLIRKG